MWTGEIGRDVVLGKLPRVITPRPKGDEEDATDISGVNAFGPS